MPYRLTRAELYRLVWASPVTEVAKRFGVSDVAVGKVCRAADIPLPPRGYWAKKAAGKEVEPTPLPARGIGRSDEVRFGDRYGYNSAPHAGSNPDDPPPPVPVFEEPLELVKARIETEIGRVRLVSLEHPHPRISALLEDEEQRRQKAQKQTYLMPSEKPRLETPGATRRLRLLNSLFTAWSDADWYPGAFEPETGDFALLVGDQRVSLRLLERPARVRADRRGRPSPPRLRLEIRYSEEREPLRVWEDSPDRKIESSLFEIAVAAVLRGEAQHREQVQRTYTWILDERARVERERARAAEKAAQAAREAARQLEQERVDLLLGAVARIERAAAIRQLIAVLGERLAGGSEHKKEIDDWIEWASAYADRIDPLLMSPNAASEWVRGFRLGK